jgi:hypothetical protein
MHSPGKIMEDSMNNTFLRRLLVGLCLGSPLTALAGGVDILVPEASRVDIPGMRPGWGFTVEGAALRSFNNNLNYFSFTSSLSGATGGGVSNSLIENVNFIENIDPNYAFNLRVGLDYTLAGSANVLKLYYEHLFARTASATFNTFIPSSGGLGSSESWVEATGSAKQKLDGVSLLSEQHILIGPSWETTIMGGVRYARVSQDLNIINPTISINPSVRASLQIDTIEADATMQYNGVGPLVGLGANFTFFRNFAIGAEAQGSLLIGLNKISSTSVETVLQSTITITETDILSDNIYSVVPELFARLYGNYLYRFNNGSELLVEAGWRVNQFFNLRTFSNNGNQSNGAFGASNGVLAPDSTNSDDIGFSGPYVLVHYKL